MSPIAIARWVVLVHIVATWALALSRGLAARKRPANRAGDERVARGAHDHEGGERWPTVSILVPAWNEGSALGACLQSLEALDYPNYETIVIAGGPDDGYRLAQGAAQGRRAVHVLEQGPQGKNAALNRGLGVAGGEVIVVLDADSRVEPGWLVALVAPIGGNILATTGRLVPSRRTAISRTEELEQYAARRIARSTTLQGSGSIALSRIAIDRIGGFPENVHVGVDWDLDARLRAAAVEIAYSPDAVVHTDRPATLGEYWTNEVRWRRAHLGAILRHRGEGILDRRSAASGLYLYVVSWLTAALTAVTAATLMRGHRWLMRWWLLLVGWLLLRRLAVALAVAACSRDPSWLRVAWLPAGLLCVTIVAILPATLTLNRASPHFRGPRPVAGPDHAG